MKEHFRQRTNNIISFRRKKNIVKGREDLR